MERDNEAESKVDLGGMMDGAQGMSDADVEAFAREYLRTRDGTMAYRAAFPSRTRGQATRRAPILLSSPRTQAFIRRLRLELTNTDDEIMAIVVELAVDSSLSAKERLEAAKVYAQLKRANVSKDGDDSPIDGAGLASMLASMRKGDGD